MDEKKRKKPNRTLTPEMEARKWKPGQSGNPKGRVLNPIQRALKELTVSTYREVIELVMTGNLDNLRAMIRNPKTSALQVGIAKAFLKAIQLGDYSVVERIAERIIGKIPDELNVNSKNLNVSIIDPDKLRKAMKKIQDDV